MKTIYLAGGCYWGVQKYLDHVYGVRETEVGFANGLTERPTYEQVKHENTGHAETVRTVYDEAMISLAELLRVFYRIIDPTSVDRQGGDVGHQYRTGVYYTDAAEEPVIRASLEVLGRGCGGPVAVECLPLSQFWPAEEYHQKYLDKNPGGYCHVPFAAIEAVKSWRPGDSLDAVGHG